MRILCALLLLTVSGTTDSQGQPDLVPDCVLQLAVKGLDTQAAISGANATEQHRLQCQFFQDTIECLEPMVKDSRLGFERLVFEAQLEHTRQLIQEECAGCGGPALAIGMLLLPLAACLRHHLQV